VVVQILVEHHPREGILAATRVLNALYDKKPVTLNDTVAILRTFAVNAEEREMEPDELARTVIERERVRLSQTSKTCRVGIS
jgi:hypothetical protein